MALLPTQTDNRFGPLAPKSSQSLVFPTRLENQPFWMSFSFYEYKMPNVSQQNVYYKDKGTIRLPLPNSMVDDQKVQYNAESLNTVTGAAVNAIQGSGSAIAAGIGIATKLSAVSGAASAIGASKALEAGLQMAGVSVNPFLTVMFKNPSFKNHAFEWKLSPSNENESMTVNSIVNAFKGNMLPDQNNALGGTLLTYPNIVQIAVSSNSKDYFTYVFKPAVIESFSVNYTVGGQPSFFGSTKAPTEVSIRLGLMEIEYWLSSDYGMATTNKFGDIGAAFNAFKGLF